KIDTAIGLSRYRCVEGDFAAIVSRVAVPLLHVVVEPPEDDISIDIQLIGYQIAINWHENLGLSPIINITFL
ncbi:hypothetical protein JTL56_32530, partial [Pseudomonas aeruginosa]|nr:hypothetical protein [Pseudomonas aeruginosa]